MPVTPVHFGPGALIKACWPKINFKFSFLIFMAVNCLIDLEPIIYFLTIGSPRHVHLHTFLLSGLLAVTVAAAWNYSAWPLINIFFKLFTKFQFQKLSFPEALVSALIAAISHIFLDSLYHYDIKPLWPFNDTNPFMPSIYYGPALEKVCLLMGALAFVIWSFRYLFRKD